MTAQTQMYSPNCSLKTQPAGTKFKLLLPPGSPGRSSHPSTPRLLDSLVGTEHSYSKWWGCRHNTREMSLLGVCTSLPWLVVVGLVGHRVFPLLSFHGSCASRWLVCPSVWVFRVYCEQVGHECVPDISFRSANCHLVSSAIQKCLLM